MLPVPFEMELRAFVDAFAAWRGFGKDKEGGDSKESALCAARDTLCRVLGKAGMQQACRTIAMFTAMNIIVDCTGIKFPRTALIMFAWTNFQAKVNDFKLKVSKQLLQNKQALLICLVVLIAVVFAMFLKI